MVQHTLAKACLGCKISEPQVQQEHPLCSKVLERIRLCTNARTLMPCPCTAADFRGQRASSHEHTHLHPHLAAVCNTVAVLQGECSHISLGSAVPLPCIQPFCAAIILKPAGCNALALILAQITATDMHHMCLLLAVGPSCLLLVALAQGTAHGPHYMRVPPAV